jgi:beta-lactamase superfamily II metal-dependent hydrolase
VTIAFLDVGHGNCAVLRSDTHTVVIDCPPGPVLRDYLHAEGVGIVDDLIISHADADHAGGVASLLKSQDPLVRRIWIADDQTNGTGHYDAIWITLAELWGVGARIDRGYPHAQMDALRFEGVEIKFLAPNHWDRARQGPRNRMSVVVRIAYRGRGVALLPGDLDWMGLERIRGNGDDFTAEWLVAPHHGGSGGSATQTEDLMSTLLELTGASNVFFSFGREGRHLFPRPELVELARARADVAGIRCSQLSARCADVHPLSGPHGGFQNPLSIGMYPPNVTSCAGSIVLDLAAPANWSLGKAHDAFVDGVYDPMCRG